MSAFLDGDKHDIRDAYNTAQQSKEAYNPQGSTDNLDTCLHLQVLRIAVPHPDGTLVIRMSLMGRVETLSVFLFEHLILCFGLQSVEGKFYATCIICPCTIDILDGSVGREHISTTILLFLVDANNLEGEVTHLHMLSFAYCQFLGLLVADDQYLTLLLDINLVDEASLHHLYLVNLDVIGINACYLTAQILLTIAHHACRTILRTHLIDDLLELLIGDVDVPFLQTNPATLFQSLIGH